MLHVLLHIIHTVPTRMAVLRPNVRSDVVVCGLNWSDAGRCGPLRSDVVVCGLNWSDAVISHTPFRRVNHAFWV